MMYIIRRCSGVKCLRLLFLDLSQQEEIPICSYILTRLTRKYYMPHCIAFFLKFTFLITMIFLT